MPYVPISAISRRNLLEIAERRWSAVQQARPDLAPQCDGLLAISYGLSANCPDDHEMLEHGMVIYDALYKWCRLQAAARAPATAMA